MLEVAVITRDFRIFTGGIGLFTTFVTRIFLIVAHNVCRECIPYICYL